MAGWVHSTPVSIVATTMPSPRRPVWLQTASALIVVIPHSMANGARKDGAVDPLVLAMRVRVVGSAADVREGTSGAVAGGLPEAPLAATRVPESSFVAAGFLFLLALARAAFRRPLRIVSPPFVPVGAALAEVVGAVVPRSGDTRAAVSRLGWISVPVRPSTVGLPTRRPTSGRLASSFMRAVSAFRTRTALMIQNRVTS